MKLSELIDNPVDNQVLWWERRSGTRKINGGKPQTHQVAVIVKSHFHNRGNIGEKPLYLDVAEYSNPTERHTLQLQVLKAMSAEEAEAHPLLEPCNV